MSSQYPWSRYWLRSGAGPWVPCCGYPPLLINQLNAEIKFHCTLYMWPIWYFYMKSYTVFWCLQSRKPYFVHFLTSKHYFWLISLEMATKYWNAVEDSQLPISQMLIILKHMSFCAFEFSQGQNSTELIFAFDYSGNFCFPESSGVSDKQREERMCVCASMFPLCGW